ncbi:MAG TPA: ABC transporter substrate-binding protein [Peptococcaceae bacterium]|nr:ABC transporter substrate-binding protein [Peptococcaceae bacterium]
MKKIWKCGLIGMLVFGLLTGCGSSPKNAAENGESQDAAGQKLFVCTSFYPMYDFAKKIGGDQIRLVNLVPSGTEPHDWEPSPQDLANLEKADVFIYNGSGMEPWAEKILGALQNEKLAVVEASQGINLLEGNHTRTEEVVEDETPYDPHVWLSPMKAKAEMKAIKEAIVQADPENKAMYEANYQTYAAKFDALDQEFKDTLSPLPNKNIIVAHQAFGYLCADYGLKQVAIEGLSADAEPDPARMAEIIDFAKANSVKVIFFEELVSPKVAESIASAIGAKTAVLNPLEGLNDQQLQAGSDYLSVMRENLQALKTALQ